MSGPKVDYAKLREQEMARLAEARGRRLKVADKIQKMINHINSCLGGDVDLMLQDPQLGPSCKKIQELQAQYKKELQALYNTVKHGTELLDVEGIWHEGEVLLRRFGENTQEELQIINKFVATSQQYQRLQEERELLAQTKRKKIVRISNNKAVDIAVSEADIQEQISVFDEEIKEFMTSPMTSKHKNSILLINQDLHELEASDLDNDRKSKRIQRLFEDYEKLTAMIQREVEDMTAIYEEYKRECFDLEAPPLSLNDFSTSKEIAEALKTVKQAAESKLSKDYIKRQIDDVMAKHGYNVVKSDLLTEANENGQVLYGVNDDTAINVFVSNDSQVTMRVVGVGFDSDISDSENEHLFQEQCAFCSMHPQITAELAMRGVILTTKKHMPPDRKFNKKIATKTKNSTQTTSKAKKELKRIGLKTLHKE